VTLSVEPVAECSDSSVIGILAVVAVEPGQESIDTLGCEVGGRYEFG
jgi:hypothetical protein